MLFSKPVTVFSSLLLAAVYASATSYDYVIVGGGPAGLTVANRLSASGTKNVLVLEAGLPHLNDPAILIPGYLGGTVGNPSYDWNFATVPQPLANNRAVPWNRGKTLGGSTAINFMAYGRPASGELDALAALGNPGWNWNSLFKYMKKAETFIPPYAPYAAENNLTYVLANHGSSGPVHTNLPTFISGAQLPWTDSLSRLGFPILKDASGGVDVGAWYSVANIDNRTQTRSYGANAYYQPVASRPNLNVITSAWASKIISTTTSAGVKATGVEYWIDGTVYTASLTGTGEVIVSAGAINSPKLLELSGIGNSTILSALGIPVKVNLPSVGENVVDQPFTGLSYELKNSSIVTLDNLRDPTFAAQALAEYQATKTGILTIGVTAFALSPLQWITNKAKALIAQQVLKVAQANVSTGVKALWAVQLAQLAQPKKFGLVEFVGFPGFFTAKSAPAARKKYLTITVDLQLPFSRGSIHISSTNYTVQPTINPNYFVENFDLEVLTESVKFARKLATTGGFADVLGPEADPGAAVQTDAQIKDYIKGFAGTEYHTIGSCAMLPKALGGVVSPKLVVYGTTNIRVVDLSIMPVQISAHPESLVWGIAEKASDIIQGITSV